jgi:polysaccharide export outer membrane protein
MTGRCIQLVAVACCCVVFASGCYDGEQIKAFLLTPRAPVSGVEYRVYPPDAIAIVSRDVPEINGVTQQVRPDGKVNLPLLGELSVAGKTPKEIEAALNELSRTYYKEVDATVTVAGYRSQSFYVFGMVSRPGPMAWTGRDTLLDVLAKARPTTLAWPERILVVRGDEPQVGGHAPEKSSWQYARTGVRPERKDQPRRRMVINLMAMVSSGDLSNNILLMPNDVVYVQPNPFARVGLMLQNLLFPIRPAVETVTMPTRVTGLAE